MISHIKASVTADDYGRRWALFDMAEFRAGPGGCAGNLFSTGKRTAALSALVACQEQNVPICTANWVNSTC